MQISVIVHQFFNLVFQHLMLQHQFLHCPAACFTTSTLEAPQFIFIQMSHADLLLGQTSHGITWYDHKGGAYNGILANIIIQLCHMASFHWTFTKGMFPSKHHHYKVWKVVISCLLWLLRSEENLKMKNTWRLSKPT